MNEQDAAGTEADRTDADLDRGAGTNGINVARQTVTKSTEHLPEQNKSLVRWAFTIARDNRWSWARLEEFTGISRNTWWKIFHDRYLNPQGERVSLDSVCRKLAALKKQHAQPAYDDRDYPFVETSVWERVDWLCRKVFARKKMGFVYGESHIGKTECLLEFQRRNNHGQTAYFELPPSGGVQLMAKAMARALHVGHDTSFDKILDNVVQAVDRDMLLIVDQIHRIFYSYQKSSVMRCLDVLMYVHDRGRCPMIFCGTNIFRDHLQEGEFKQYLKQFRRRGLYEIQLPSVPPRADLDMIAAQYGLAPANGEAEKLMLAIARNDGLAMFFTRLEDAAELAGKQKTPLAWHHFERVVTITEKMSRLEDEPRGRR